MQHAACHANLPSVLQQLQVLISRPTEPLLGLKHLCEYPGQHLSANLLVISRLQDEPAYVKIILRSFRQVV